MNRGHLSPQGRGRPTVKQAWKHNVLQRKLYFRGVPAPVAAAYALVPMMLRLSSMEARLGAVGEVGAWAIGRRGTGVTLLCTAVLMVSALPTLSSKMLKMSGDDTHLRSRGLCSMILKGAALMALPVVAWKFIIEFFLLLSFGHMLSIPVGLVIYYKFATELFEKDS
mmetsp:Transcript_156608/g.288778  ORF Transcript_156608/g.288778 Transcript_156608/m.288778 type:complete len:167 (+) Transcript_156608:2-502(+)